MPVNKLALLRYKTIDQCLQNRFRKWTLADLIEAVGDALYEFEGITSGVSKRTIQLDIQNMRSDKLGYHAPIEVVDRKFYTYADRNYSITNVPLSNNDMDKLNEVVSFLKQFKGFGFFEELTTMVARLEDKVARQNKSSVSYIDFDRNELLKGLEFIEPIHQAIRKQTTLLMRYQSFRASAPHDQLFFAYLLKEYNNRWFVLGKVPPYPNLSLLALDRIIALKESPFDPYEKPEGLDITHYFDDMIGVSKPNNQTPSKIVLRILKSQLPYITTKPMHPSQTILKEEENTVIFSLDVHWNYELEREIIGLGEVIEVLSPKRLRFKMIKRLEETLALYHTPIKGEEEEE